MVIDAHVHIIVRELTREKAPAEAWRPKVVWEAGRQVVELDDRRITSAVREFVDIDTILAVSAAAGVQRVLLSPWVTLLRYDATAEEGLRISRIQNAALSALAQRYPDRIKTLGTVPLQEPALAASELEALMGLPGVRGVEVAASVRGAPLGDDRFRPFWEIAESTGALVFVHPTTRGFDVSALNDYYLWNTIGNPLETTIAAAHLVMAGVMERHPRLKVLLAHAGGALLSLRGRLRHAHSFQPQARSRLRETTDESLRRFYFDTVTHDAAVLRNVVEFAGPDHVLMGSDYPFDMGAERPMEIVRALELPVRDEAAILGGNAARLLGWEG